MAQSDEESPLFSGGYHESSDCVNGALETWATFEARSFLAPSGPQSRRIIRELALAAIKSSKLSGIADRAFARASASFSGAAESGSSLKASQQSQSGGTQVRVSSRDPSYDSIPTCNVGCYKVRNAAARRPQCTLGSCHMSIRRHCSATAASRLGFPAAVHCGGAGETPNRKDPGNRPMVPVGSRSSTVRVHKAPSIPAEVMHLFLRTHLRFGEDGACKCQNNKSMYLGAMEVLKGVLRF
ncbi:hypothetical protein PSPO01_13942 [Paraphaeosphaeria sporulosa]